MRRTGLLIAFVGAVVAPLAGCVAAPTTSDGTAEGEDARMDGPLFPVVLADQSYEMTSSQTPCDDRTDPRLQTHCRYFRPQAGRVVGNGTGNLTVEGRFTGLTTPGRQRLLFSAWFDGNAQVEYRPVPAGANLTIGITAAQWDAPSKPSAWQFRLDFEGTGRVDARVRVFGDS
ncbi:MAG TPA: hypothetical protein VI818_07335 [Candidatus Thermoplasmatota archaeon]|nr:hypothetical protein [Candidatus Thermoplasmatota archaeon]